MVSVSPQRFGDHLIIEVVDKALNSLGESPKKAIWYCLENNFKVYRDDLPKNIVELEEALQKIFGLGYNFIDALFRQYLKEAASITLDSSQRFSECIYSLKLEAKNL